MGAGKWVVACKIGWLVAAVFVYGFSVIRFQLLGDSDAEVYLIYGMLLLSFPVSWVIAAGATLIVAALQSPAGEVVQTSWLSMTVFWIAQCIGGYLQWFVLIPWFRWGKNQETVPNQETVSGARNGVEETGS